VPRAWIAAVLLAAVALGWGLGTYPLLEPDEGRNVQVAREMVRGGDWVLPHLNDLPYLDKPAPYFAAVALSMRAFGESEGAARFASLLFIVGTALIVWRLGRRMGPPGTGEIAAVAFATMPLTIAFSRTVIPDPALAFLETLTLAAAWRGFTDEHGAEAWFAFAWAAIGTGAVTKGPVAIIMPLLILGVFGLVAGVRLRPLFALKAWPWMLVTGLPWFIAVTQRRPDFPRYAFVYESLERVATTTHGRGGPLWYFVPVLLAGSFPWIVPAVSGAVSALRGWSRRREPASRAALFLASWALVPLVFFSFSQSKLPGYYLPALPGVALAAGMFLATARTDLALTRALARSATVAGALLLALAAAFVLGSRPAGSAPWLTAAERAAAPGFALAFAGLLLAAGAGALWAARRRRVLTFAAVLALPMSAVPVLGGPMMKAIGRDRSSQDLARAIETAAPGVRVAGLAAYPTSLRYYLDRPVLLATATGREMTSNYVASRLEEFRAMPGSPLRPAAWWRPAVTLCDTATVFVARRGSPEADSLAVYVRLLATGGAANRFVAFGPCRSAAGEVPR
jgi:4-amino-4-deoxy-L-arabinose transferase-like glycosyltransferase